MAPEYDLLTPSCQETKPDITQKNAWFSFIKAMASFRGDLSSLTAPPFLLSSTSVIEYSAYWAEHPSLLVAPASEPDPEKRALLVLRWFLSTLKEQHNNKDENGRKKKLKPLNPFLGEIFRGQWEDDAGTTKLVAEQVSHHPPVTAYRVWNNEHGVKLQGHIAPKAYFSSTVHIDRKGYGILHIDKYNEDYLITMPKMHIEGLMTGSLFPELGGTSTIRSSLGFTATIEYSGKGWLRGESNSFKASLFHEGNPDKLLYTVDGQWSGSMAIKEMKTQQTSTFDSRCLRRTPLKIAPLEMQDPLESRRAWQKVSAAIEQGDVFRTGCEKSKIENQQREMRKLEKIENRQWQSKYFRRVESDFVVQQLAQGSSIDSEINYNGAGFWAWDDEKVRDRSDSGVFM